MSPDVASVNLCELTMDGARTRCDRVVALSPEAHIAARALVVRQRGPPVSSLISTLVLRERGPTVLSRDTIRVYPNVARCDNAVCARRRVRLG